MSCSQCYTVQVPECIDNLFINAIIGDESTDIVIKITDSHGNVYFIEGEYSDGRRVKVDFKIEHLPKNLSNRYAGAITLEVINSVGVVATMIICDKEYTCITLDVINNNLSLTDYYIGCAS